MDDFEWILRLLQVLMNVCSIASRTWQKFLSKSSAVSTGDDELVGRLLSLGSVLCPKVRILLVLYRCKGYAASVDDVSRWTKSNTETYSLESVLSDLHDAGLVRFDIVAGRVELLNSGYVYLVKEVLTPCQQHLYRQRRESA